VAWSLLASIVCLILWVVLVFIRPVGLGVVHVLLAVSAVLLIRWYALRPLSGEGVAGSREP
jgi:hypothetical protein